MLMAKEIITIEVSKCKCEKCGKEWTAKTTDPRQCPACKTAKWNIKD